MSTRVLVMSAAPGPHRRPTSRCRSRTRDRPSCASTPSSPRSAARSPRRCGGRAHDRADRRSAEAALPVAPRSPPAAPIALSRGDRRRLTPPARSGHWAGRSCSRRSCSAPWSSASGTSSPTSCSTSAAGSCCARRTRCVAERVPRLGRVLARSSTALWSSAKVALIGLAISIVLGMASPSLMSQAKLVERAVFPYMVMLQAIPILALVPLIGFWFGTGSDVAGHRLRDHLAVPDHR